MYIFLYENLSRFSIINVDILSNFTKNRENIYTHCLYVCSFSDVCI